MKLDADGANYLQSKKTVEMYLKGHGKEDHLTKGALTDLVTKDVWIWEDMDPRVDDITTHCNTIKELW